MLLANTRAACVNAALSEGAMGRTNATVPSMLTLMASVTGDGRPSISGVNGTIVAAFGLGCASKQLPSTL